MENQNFDYISDVIEEIAYEGLDGITITALWLRLGARKGFCLSIDEHSKSFIWNHVGIHPGLEFYELPDPRPPLVLFSRYDHRDSETGMCLEVLKESGPDEIYPIKMIDERHKEFRGSCVHFETRIPITEFVKENNIMVLSLGDAIQKYGEKLVIVASQEIRHRLLMGEGTDPQLEISNMQYAMLEMIGRSREHGIVTTGQVCSFMGLNESPKSLFYHRKLLIKKQLIKRQLHFQRNKSTTQWGFVFHLPRFYMDRPTAVNLMLQKLCTILQSKPNQTELFSVVRTESGIPETTFKKILARGQPLSQFTEVSSVGYRIMHPDAPDSEALSSKKVEKMLKVVKLVKPFSWNSLLEEGEADEEDDENEFYLNTGKNIGCDSSRFMMIRPIVCQAYDMLYKHSPEGMSERELQRSLGITRLDARSVCRYLTRASLVDTYMKDKGRQRMTMYVIAEHLHMSQAHRSILEERQKILESESMEDKTTLEFELDDSRVIPVTLTNRIFRHGGSILASVLGNDAANSSGSESGANFSRNSLNNSNTSKKPDSDSTFNFYDKNLTARQLSRANFILDMVKRQIFVDDVYKIQRALAEKETKEGCKTKLDKRSVMTIVKKLSNDGFIKSINTVLKLGDNAKKLHFVCLPDIGENSQQVQSAVHNAKLRLVGLKYTDTKKIYASTRKANIKKEVISPEDAEESLMDAEVSEDPSTSLQLHQEWKNKTAGMKFQPSMGKQYGLLPKFNRAHILHELLFYLVHDYQGREDDVTPTVTTDELMIIDGKEIKVTTNQPTVYSEKKEWKMFLPPVPVSEGFPTGWCLVSDILQRIPVCLYVQMVNIPFEIDGFREYLDHPIKRFYLISDLPIKIRNSLLMSRRYIFHINDILIRLCYMGLVSFGPQVHKDKDQVYIYIHRIASVMDTTISEPGHYIISSGEDYSWRFHLLNSLTDVQNFWLDLKTVCLNTPLGRKMNDKDGVSINADLAKSLDSKTIDEIIDEGRVPGDHCGAGGLDSSLCSYLKRNWASSQFPDRNSKGGVKKRLMKQKTSSNNVPLPQLLQQTGDDVTLLDKKKRLNRLPKQVSLLMEKSGEFGSSVKDINVTVTLEKNESSIQKAAKFRIMKKKINMNKMMKKNKTPRARKREKPIDARDMHALSTMKTQRAVWSTQEDTFLLLAKVASILMGSKYLCVTAYVLRDEHLKYCSKLNLKTSHSCLRRFNFLTKKSKAKNNVHVMVQESRQNEAIMNLVKRPYGPIGSTGYIIYFQNILKGLINLFTNRKPLSNVDLPQSLHELHEQFAVKIASDEIDVLKKNHHKNPKNTVDIHFYVVFNIIMTSVHSTNFHKNWGYHLFKLFSQYPENLLKAVLTRMRKDGVITLRKKMILQDATNSLTSAQPYHISMMHQNVLNTKYQHEIFDHGYEIYQKMMEASSTKNPFVMIAPNTGEGIGMALQALMATKAVVLRTEVPEQIIEVQDQAEPPSKKIRRDATSSSEFQIGTSRNSCITQLDDEVSEVKFFADEVGSVHLFPASRLGLHLMRKQIFKAPVFRNVQHAGDYFVMNSCDVYAKLRSSSASVLPLNESKVLDWTKPKTIDPDLNISIQQYCASVSTSAADKERAVAVYNAVKRYKSVGITHADLVKAVAPLMITPMELLEVLKSMMLHSMIVRVGVECYTYVTFGHTYPWLMRTLIIPKDKTTLATFASRTGDIPVKSNLDVQDIYVDDDDDCDNIIEAGTSSTATLPEIKSKRRKITKALTKEIIPSFEESECVKVHLIGRPWNKPDGFINKNIMYTLIRSVASRITLDPGISEKNICLHYSPFIQQVITLDLLEMLVDSGCISKTFIQRKIKNPGPFFSSSFTVTKENGIYEDFETYYEPEPDILLKVARIKDILKVKKAN